MKAPKSRILTLSCERKLGLWWIKDVATGRTLSMSLNRPSELNIQLLSRAVGWPHQQPATFIELLTYRRKGL